jgi:hypothetical protein
MEHVQKFFFASGIHWVPLAHTCNPNYLGGSHQENHDLRTMVLGKKARLSSRVKP